MRPATRSPFLSLARGIVAVLLLLLIVAAFMPEIRSDRWWIRYGEFPRLQFLVATVALMAMFVVIGGLRGRTGKLVTVAAAIASLFQGWQLLPFTPFVPTEIATAQACAPERTLRLLSLNVQAGNRNGEAVLEAVRMADADIVLLLETDAWWDAQIAKLYDRYPNHMASQPRAAHYYGMQVLSRLPLSGTDMVYLFDEATPTLETSMTLRDGSSVRLLGLHPRPPLSEPQPTTLRDGSIAAMAKVASASAAPVIMAGDMNATPWSDIVRLAKRVGHLADPRVGRGFIASFDADSSWMRWPLDHILAQDAFQLLAFERLAAVGSDHYPMAATLCLSTDAATRTRPRPSDADMARIDLTIAAAGYSK